jgi:hypothetical protein
MAETKEERRLRIQKEVAEESAARREAYFKAQEESKAKAAAAAAPLPKPDAYVYDYAWRQGAGTPEGELKLIKSPNPYYDASTNEIVDPVTGARRPATQSMYTGAPTSSDALYDAKRAAGYGIDAQGKPITTSSDSLYASKYAAGYGMDAQGNQYRGAGTSSDPLTINGSSFTGTWQGKTYENGLLKTATSSSSTSTLSTSAATLAAQQAAQAAAEEKRRTGQSAYALLFSEFERYGLGALVAPLQGFIVEGLSQAEFTLRLRDTDAYRQRFAANAQRINKGLRALSEAEYIGLEDQYQSVMRQYGLPQSYYSRGDMGRQEGFEKFIAGDVSPVELEDRIQTAQNRVTNAPKQVRDALTQFYGAELGNGDILAYVLDPEKALSQIKRKVTAAEIGGGAAIAGLGLGKERAEELGMFGVTGEQARTGYQTIAEFLPTATKLGDIYAKQGLGPYTQTAAESEVFGVTGAADASQKRRKLAQLESAQFSGTSGAAQGALARERAGQY